MIFQSLPLAIPPSLPQKAGLLLPEEPHGKDYTMWFASPSQRNLEFGICSAAHLLFVKDTVGCFPLHKVILTDWTPGLIRHSESMAQFVIQCPDCETPI